MPFTLIADNNNASVKVANFSTYLINEFYTYTKLKNGTEIVEYFDAVDCIDYYTDLFGSFDKIPSSL